MSSPPAGATIPPPSPEGLALAQKLAVTLGETEEKPIIQLARAVDYLGPERAQEYTQEAVTLAAGEGILTRDGSRKRTPGGTFFALVRQRLVNPKKDWRKIKPVMKQKAIQPTTLAEQMPMLIEMTTRLKAGQGSGTTATLIGRPVTVQKQAQFVAFTVKEPKVPALPKGLPTFKGETKYLVLASTKHWEKVEKRITDNKEDQLFVKGFTTVQANFSGIVILATEVNTLGAMRTSKK
ncbi:MAG TPA: hypothetical protein VH590_13765 [Ktedonobacterales bacterium]|jgi:hypothetical protein